MGIGPRPDQSGNGKNYRAVKRGGRKRGKPDFEAAGRPDSQEIIAILERVGVFDRVLRNIRLKYGIGG